MPSTPGVERMTLEDAVWVDPDRMSGAPCFRGSRLPVQQLFDWLADGVPLDEFIEDFRIDRAAAEAVLRTAGAHLCQCLSAGTKMAQRGGSARRWQYAAQSASQMSEIARDNALWTSEPGNKEERMSQVINYLERFNRKERFILLSHALGGEGGEAFFLNPDFRETLASEIDVLVPKDAFVAMDFHLDWLQMALYLADHVDSLPCVIPNEERRLVSGNQEDVDLLIAFEDEGTHETHIVLVEAKADTGWTNKQLKSKAKRLRRIFDKQSYGTELVKSHFILMSPRRPKEIETNAWPHWMRSGAPNSIHWLPLQLRDGLLKVTRCNENKKPAKDGGFLFVREHKEGAWGMPQR